MADLVSRLKNEEDNFIERKPEGVRREELRRTIVAFANSIPEERTAILYIGVSNNGDIKGVSNPDQMQKTIQEVCERDCYPPIKFSIEVLNVENKKIIAIVIPYSNNRPHFSGPAYIRRGSQSVIASEQVFDELIATRSSKVHEIMKWKYQIVTVIAIGKKLGSTKPINSSMYRECHECRVVECKVHYIRLFNIATDSHLSEPLEHVSLAHDEEKNRLMLIVK